MLSDEVAERVKALSKIIHEEYHLGDWETCEKITCSSDRELYHRYLSTFDTIYWCGVGRHYKDTPQHGACG